MSQKIDFKELLSQIKSRGQNRAHFTIAFSGFGGSGKSTSAEKIGTQLGDAVVIHLDDFIVDQLSIRSSDWEGFDWGRLVEQVLQPISQGADAVTYGVYDWKTNTVDVKKTIALKKYVIIEGVGLIRDSLKEYLDMTVWLDVPLDIASQRGKRRDVEEYGLPHHADLWNKLWTPNDYDYFVKYQPDVKADFLLKNE